jgi:homoserine O-succinyltransferase
VLRQDIEKVPGLHIIAESPKAGVTIVEARNGREFFITCHLEDSPLTLDGEYKRDLKKGLPINKPQNYYPGGDPKKHPVVKWRAAANLLYTNWLNYYVYQETPFNINDIN